MDEMHLQNTYTYQIEVEGRINEKTFNAASPIQIRVENMQYSTTLLTVYTDQSGIIGLLRHLHRQGFVLIVLKRQKKGIENEN